MPTARRSPPPCRRYAVLAQNHPHRHGRLLRLGGAARPAGTARPAGNRRRRSRRPRRGRGLLVRGPGLRRPLGHARRPGGPALPAGGVPAAAHGPLPRGVAPDHGPVPPLHAAGGAAVRGRGLPRRHRKPPWRTLRHPAGPGDPRRDPRDHRPDRLGRGLLQQVPRQGGLGETETRRPHRDPARSGRRLHQGPAHRQVLRRGPGDRGEDAQQRHPHRPGPAALYRAGTGGPVRQGRPVLLRDRPRPRHPAGGTGAGAQVRGRGDHPGRGHRRPGPGAGSARRAGGQAGSPSQRPQDRRPHPVAQGPLQRLHHHHPLVHHQLRVLHPTGHPRPPAPAARRHRGRPAAGAPARGERGQPLRRG